MKICSKVYLSSGKCKLKPQSIATRLLEWLRIKSKLILLSIGKDLGKRELSDIAGMSVKWYNYSWKERKWYCSVVSDSLWPHGRYLPGFSIRGIFQARVLEWVAFSFSRGSSQPRDWTQVSCIASRRFTVWATREVSKRVWQFLMK